MKYHVTITDDDGNVLDSITIDGSNPEWELAVPDYDDIHEIIESDIAFEQGTADND